MARIPCPSSGAHDRQSRSCMVAAAKEAAPSGAERKRPQEELAVPSRKLRFLPRRLALTILASILLAIFLGGMSLWEQHGKGVKVTPTLIAATIIVAVLLSLAIAIPIGIAVALEGVPDNLAGAASPKTVLENDRKVVVMIVLATAPATALIFGRIGEYGATASEWASSMGSWWHPYQGSWRAGI